MAGGKCYAPFYCYFMFFFWPTWLTRCADAAAVNNFFAGYGDQRIEYADELWRSTAPNPLMGEGI
ncbi:MAG: hypothetical protein PHD32_09835 [Eubacteriales bacterium]|nr:hypothetical protein [Eubacteriales bacterium]